MLKVLLKKQFKELFSLYFQNQKRKRKHNSTLTGTLIVIVVALCMFGIFGMAMFFSQSMFTPELTWIYFALFGMLALVVSILVNAFMANSILFKAKDNLLLLSLPIQPKTILLSRMAIVFFNCTLFTTLIWLPASLCYWLMARFSIEPLIMLLILPLIALTFSCIIGFLISFFIRSKAAKTILTVVFSVLLIVVVLGTRAAMNTIMQTVLSNAALIGSEVEHNAYPIFMFGKACTGDLMSLLIWAAIAIIPVIAIWLIMSKTFIVIITNNKGSKKAVYMRSRSKQGKISFTLLKKEIKLFLSIPTYIVNNGIGSIFMLIVGVLMIFQIDTINEFIPILNIAGQNTSIAPALIVSTIALIAGLCPITTPSISIEGRKNIWILQSSPIKPINVFMAKINLQLVFTLLPAYFCAVCMCISLKTIVLATVFVIVATTLVVFIEALKGMKISLKRANLDWINVIQPLKQNIGILITMLFSFGLCILIIVLGIAIPSEFYLLGVSVVLALWCWKIYHWLKTKGSILFTEL